jgi:hypothetical protein
VARPGLDLGERLRPVVVAETVGWLGVGLGPPAGSAKTPRALRASYHAEGSGLWPEPWGSKRAGGWRRATRSSRRDAS